MKSLLSFILILFITMVQSTNHTDVRNLLKLLFKTNSYDTLVRPKINQSEPVVANVEYFLYAINDVNEVERKLTTTGYLAITWKDEFLTWDRALYGNLDYVYIPQDNVWKPDISLQNGFKNLEGLGSSFIQVRVEPDGQVNWNPFQIFESKCKLDPTYFPFDHQTCNLDFIAWSLSINDVILYVENDWVSVDAAKNSNGQWNVVASSAMNVTENYDTITRFSITIKRKPLFVVMNIIIPIILLSILNIFTFQIPSDMEERMGYTITVWLAFAVFLTIVSSSLPKSSDAVPVVSIFIMIQLCVGTLTVLISSIESRMVCRSDDQPVPAFIRQITLVCRRPRIAPTDGKMNMHTSLKDGLATIDCLIFWSLLALLAIVTFIIMMVAVFSR